MSLFLFVISPQLTGVSGICTLTNWKKGLPIRCVMVTETFGSSIENYHYVWKIPPHVSFENASIQNQQVVRVISDELPKYHTQCMRREFMSILNFGLVSQTTKQFVLQGIDW